MKMNYELDNRQNLKHEHCYNLNLDVGMKLILETWHELDMNLEHGHDTRMNLKMANSRLG